MRTRTLTVPAILLAFVAQAQVQTYDLSIKPVKGKKTTYALTLEIAGQGQRLTIHAKLVNEIVDVKEDGGFIAASYQSDHKLFVNDKAQPAIEESVTGVATYDKQGRPLTIGGDQAGPDTMRIAKLTSFVAPKAPVRVGEEWRDLVPKDKETGSNAVVHNYKLRSVETQNGLRVAVVDVTTTETTDELAGSTKGIVVIDLDTGEQVRYEVQVRNFQVGDQYVNGKVTLVKV